MLLDDSSHSRAAFRHPPYSCPGESCVMLGWRDVSTGQAAHCGRHMISERSPGLPFSSSACDDGSRV